jgi:hypothetical protein
MNLFGSLSFLLGSCQHYVDDDQLFVGLCPQKTKNLVSMYVCLQRQGEHMAVNDVSKQESVSDFFP